MSLALIDAVGACSAIFTPVARSYGFLLVSVVANGTLTVEARPTPIGSQLEFSAMATAPGSSIGRASAGPRWPAHEKESLP